MKDLHSHILYGIDDGCRDIEESIELLKRVCDSGTKEIILTPHYIENSKYDSNNRKKQELFYELKERLEKEKIDIKVYLGNEVFVTDNFMELLDREQIMTLNSSRYLLFEFPMGSVYNNTPEIISTLITRGYVPVLAHPERYKAFQDCPMLADEYLRMGVQLQGNYTSLFGKYGKTAEKTLKILLKNKKIAFLGSDVHHEVCGNSAILKKKLLKLTKDEKYVEDLLVNNFDKVINDEEIGLIC